MAAIIAYSDDSIIGITVGGFFTSWNTPAENLFGYTSKEIIGHHEGDGPSPGWIGHAVERVHPLRQAVPVPGSGRRQDLLAHLLAQDLAEHRAWHVLDLHDPTRDLVGR